MSPLDGALRMLQKHGSARILPLNTDNPNRSPKEIKTPRIDDWQNKASNRPSDVRAWANIFKNPNFGVILTEGFILDVDVRDGKPGLASLAKLEKDLGFKAQDTFIVKTPTGGLHIYFSTDLPVAKQKLDSRGYPGLDIQSGVVPTSRGYAVSPGSRIHGKEYTIENDLEIAKCPKALEELLVLRTSSESAKPGEVAEGCEVDSKYNVQRAIDFAKNVAPAVEGQHGDEKTVRLAMELKDFGISKEKCLEIMAEYFNPRCEPPWELSGPDSLEAKVSSAYKSGKNKIGSKDPKLDFTAIEEEIPEWVKKENQKYFVINDGGEAVVGYVTSEIFIDEFGVKVNRDKIQTQSFENYRKLRMHLTCPEPILRRTRALGDNWLAHPKRKIYEGGFVFFPNMEAPKDSFNLWRGFSVNPKPGSWAKFRNFIREVICSNDETADTYLINWLARMIQRPWEQGKVAVVLRGKKGTGKDTFCRPFVELFGHHGLAVAKSDLLVGRFNSHLRDAICVFANEAMFAGDKQNEGFLKTLITEPNITTEEKFKSARMSQNRVHLLMASNENWVIPASSDERRFLVLDVSDKYAQDTEYFGEIKTELNRGGLAALLYDLQKHDLSGFDVFDVPQTKALANQKLASLKGSAAWLFDVLNTGRIKRGLNEYLWTAKGVVLQRSDAYESYKEYSKEHREYSPETPAVWGKEIRRLVGACIKDFRHDGKWHLEFRPLWECREAFEKGMDIEAEAAEWEKSAFEEEGDIFV